MVLTVSLYSRGNSLLGASIMFKVFLTVALSCLLSLSLAGCEHTNGGSAGGSTGNNPQPDGSVVGLNVRALSDGEKFTPRPSPNYYYGQLIIEPTLSASTFQGPEARTLLSYVFQVFGSEAQQFGISVTPVIDGVKLPPVVPVSYKYDSSANKWESNVVQRYVSPLVRLSGNTSLAYSFSFVAARDREIPLAEKIADLTSNIAGLTGTGWVVSTLSKPVVDRATRATDEAIATLLSKEVSATVSGLLQPAFNGEREKNYQFLTGDGTQIAQLRMQARLTSTIEGSQVLAPGQTVAESIPQADPFNDPRSTIWIDSSRTKILSEYIRGLGYAERLPNTTDPAEFAQICGRLRADIQTSVGLNVFDTVNVMRWVLTGTNYGRNADLYNSPCLPDQYKELMEKMGIGIVLAGKPIPQSTVDEAFDAIGNFARNPEGDIGPKVKFIEGVLTERLFLVDGTGILSESASTGVMVDRRTLVETLPKLEVARFCCYRRPWINGEPDRSSSLMFLRQRNKSEYVKIQLSRDDETSKFRSISLWPTTVSAEEARTLDTKWTDHPAEL